MQICKKCVMNENFPGIAFNGDGICSLCSEASDENDQNERKVKNEKRFQELVHENRGKSGYDCLVAYSGGKDSTYTLYLMKNKYKLRILAFSLNNWFQSETALKNIRTVIQKLSIDHLAVSPPYEQFKKMILLAASKELYARKALERASSVCLTCISLIRYIGFKIAVEKHIPFVVLGMTPGQAGLKASLFKTNSKMLMKMQQASFQPLLDHGLDFLEAYLLKEQDFQTDDTIPYNVNPLSFSEYDEQKIYAIIETLGWIAPEDTDPNSTNCLLNAYANQIHLERYGFHPYLFEIAGLVRHGCISREAGLAKVSSPAMANVIASVSKELGSLQQNITIERGTIHD